MSFHDIEPPREGGLLRDFVLFEEIMGRFLDDYTEAVAELRLAAASECVDDDDVLPTSGADLMHAEVYATAEFVDAPAFLASRGKASCELGRMSLHPNRSAVGAVN